AGIGYQQGTAGSFLEFLQFNELKCDGLTQLVILMDSWLGFSIYRLMSGKNFNEIKSFAENLRES
ncbi:MAG: hypothetical protein ACYSSI_09565, partial [Planctomycetota bacterium]